MDVPAVLTEEKCLIQDCGNAASYRGLCRRCHRSARRAIAAKLVTEAQLVEERLLLPSVRGCRKTKSPWRVQFERACGKPG